MMSFKVYKIFISFIYLFFIYVAGVRSDSQPFLAWKNRHRQQQRTEQPELRTFQTVTLKIIQCPDIGRNGKV
jgi:hypothetical protein